MPLQVSIYSLYPHIDPFVIDAYCAEDPVFESQIHTEASCQSTTIHDGYVVCKLLDGKVPNGADVAVGLGGEKFEADHEDAGTNGLSFRYVEFGPNCGLVLLQQATHEFDGREWMIMFKDVGVVVGGQESELACVLGARLHMVIGRKVQQIDEEEAMSGGMDVEELANLQISVKMWEDKVKEGSCEDILVKWTASRRCGPFVA